MLNSINFFNKLNHTFTSASARKEYETLSRTQFIKFLRVFLLMITIYGFYSMYRSFREAKDYKGGILLTAWTITLILLWIFCEKLQKCMSYLVILVCVPIFIPDLIQTDKVFLLSPFGFYAFFAGYFMGFFERIVSFRLPNFWYKSIYTVSIFLMRGFIFGKNMLPYLFVHVLIFSIGLVLDFFRINEDQKVFQSFYDYREELIKFRTLMISGLPIKILILSKDLKQKLFMNERCQLLLDEQTDRKEDINYRIRDFLNRIHLDKQNLNERTKLFVSSNDSPLPTFQFLQTLTEQSLLHDQNQKILFNAFLQDENPMNRKVFEVTVYSLLWDSQDAMAIILTDVTVQHQNLALKIADANKDKMLALISHELKTPLNGILGVVQLLEKGTNDSQTLQHLNVCKVSGQLLLNLVNSILDLQHIRDNRFSLKINKINLNELLHEIYDLFKLQFEQKGLKLTLNAAQDLPLNFSTDQNRLKQILINLLGNALKFTFEGGVEITATKRSSSYIEFRVSDTGTGIKEEDQGKLFKMYGRLEQENPQTNTQGVGFGLEISNQLAKLLCEGDEGGIRFHSQVGKGTTFYFFIKESMSNRSPLIGRRKSKARKISISGFDETDFEEIDCDELLIQRDRSENLSFKMDSYIMRTGSKVQIESTVQIPKNRLLNNSKISISSPFLPPRVSLCSKLPNQTDSPYDSEAPETPSLYNGETHKSLISPLKKLKILIVDDNPFNLLVARHLAENLGYDTDTALNGKIAVEMLENGKKSYCAILMDLQMPVMDGYEATRTLKKMMDNGEIVEIPIIALSANDSPNDKERCKEIGMRDHIAKPLDEKRLKMVLEEVMDDDDDSSISTNTKLTIPK